MAAQPRSNFAVKLALVLGIVFIGGAVAFAAVMYAAHAVKTARAAKDKLSQMASAVTHDDATGAQKAASADSAPTSDDTTGFSGDPCKLLSKEEVGSTIGVPIVEARHRESGCEYLARGTQADMTAKHMSAMLSTKGADKKTQDMMQQITGGFFKSMSDAQVKPDSGDETVPVLVFSIDRNSARSQLHLNEKTLERPGSTEPLDGIGDEAFNSADSMMMFRKGDKMVRIMYMTCPCGLEAVKPLAQKLAAGL